MSESHRRSGSSQARSKGSISPSLVAGYRPSQANSSGPGGFKPNLRSSVRGSRASSRASRLTGGGPQQREYKVIDEDGRDRTPKPLLGQQNGSVPARQGLVVPGTSLPENGSTDAERQSVRLKIQVGAAEFSTQRLQPQLSGVSMASEAEAISYGGAVQRQPSSVPGDKVLISKTSPATSLEVSTAEQSRRFKVIRPIEIVMSIDNADEESNNCEQSGCNGFAESPNESHSQERAGVTGASAQSKGQPLGLRNKGSQTKKVSMGSVSCQAYSWAIWEMVQAVTPSQKEDEVVLSASLKQNEAPGGADINTEEAGEALAEAVEAGEPLPTDRSGTSVASSSKLSQSERSSTYDMSRASADTFTQGIRQSVMSAASRAMRASHISGVSHFGGGGFTHSTPTKQDPLLRLAALPEALQAMDAALLQDAHLLRLLKYRGLPTFMLQEQTEGPVRSRSYSTSQLQQQQEVPAIELLWEWECELAPGMTVTCMALLPEFEDSLAVGYGPWSVSAGGLPQAGLVCFWSVRNLRKPLWSFKTRCGVTALAASAGSSSLLAVGLQDGTLQLHELGQRKAEPAVECSSGSGKHAGPVWDIVWVDKGPQKQEELVTASADGKVCQWQYTKGLDPRTLATVQHPSSETAELLQHVGALCLQFCRAGRTFLVSTEGGTVEEYRTSFAEQSLNSYKGHLGCVHKVQESPFAPGLFMTASEDWTLKLWSQAQGACLLTLQSGTEGISDVQWSPTNSTQFVAATAGGQVQLWDIEASITSPAIMFSLPGGAAATQVLFSPTRPVLFVGSSIGSVAVLRLHHTQGNAEDAEGVDKLAEAERLEVAIDAHTAKAISSDK